MDKHLPARPNLDHLRGQAKQLLAQLADGDPVAAQAFIEHLPAARSLTPTALRTTKLKLADAQSVIARQNGFASWAILARHVDELRSLEGDWRIATLEVDGMSVPATMLEHSRILFDGDRFRTESPEGTYEGIFSIDTEASPRTIDIRFVSGPEAGNTCYGIYKLDATDAITLCLGLDNATRPSSFAAAHGSGRALEQLRRVSTARPNDVTGGTPPAHEESAPLATQAQIRAFDEPSSAVVDRLQGEWVAIELATEGKQAPEAWLAFGRRTMRGNVTEVVFGGQTIVHAKVRVDDTTTPIAVDYLNLSGKQQGTISLGILEWIDGDARFLMALPGAPRPTDFDEPRGTLSRWRKR